jgi:hypothetical protein
VNHSLEISHNQLIFLRKGKGLYRERFGRGMLRPNLREGCKAWDRREMDFGKVSLF